MNFLGFIVSYLINDEFHWTGLKELKCYPSLFCQK